MADKIVAINSLRPRVKLGKRVMMKEVARIIAGRSTMNEGEVFNALKELRDTIAAICLSGRAVTLEGIGTYTPTLKLDGTFGVAHKMHEDIRIQMNTEKAFLGDIVNKQNIGKTSDELITLWNEANPDNLVTP